jgi:hypothetical protein
MNKSLVGFLGLVAIAVVGGLVKSADSRSPPAPPLDITYEHNVAAARDADDERENRMMEGCAFLLRTINPNASATLDGCRKLRAKIDTFDDDNKAMACVLANARAWGTSRGFNQPQLLPPNIKRDLMTGCFMFITGATQEEAQSIVGQILRTR